MHKDQKEELWRIQEALLAEEPEEIEETDDAQDFLWEEEYQPEDESLPSRRQGEPLRNYANGYRAYNRDKTDEDLEEYSREVWEGKRSGGIAGLVIAVILLSLAIIAVLAFWAVRYGGLL